MAGLHQGFRATATPRLPTMQRPFFPSRRQIPRWLAFNAIIAAAYFALGSLGLALALPPGFVSAIWPAAGMAFATMALWGERRVALGVFLGSVLTNATVGGGFHIDTVAVGIAVGSTLQALVGGLLAPAPDSPPGVE